MDSLGKAFKTGLAKAYAAGQQQVQKLQDQSSGSRPPQGSSYSGGQYGGGQYGGGQHGGGQYGGGYHNAAPVSRAMVATVRQL